MAQVEVTLSADASPLQVVVDRMKPIVDRLDAQVCECEPDSPVSRLEVVFEDVFECLRDAGLLIAVTKGDGPGGDLGLTVVPSPVLDRLCDLLTAICEGIDARMAKAPS